MILKRVGIAVFLTAVSFPLAAQQDSQSMVEAIKAEGMRSPEARIIFHTDGRDRASADRIASARAGRALGRGTPEGLGARQPAA